MAERGGTSARRSLDRDPGLVVASVYQREVRSALSGVWENVFDWEHLPWLHAQAFSSIECVAEGEWGWHAQVGFPGDQAAEIELVADREAGRYVARTVSGAGAPAEVWTRLEAAGADSTSVRVEFCVSRERAGSAEELAQLGKGYVDLYAHLWDQDEEMILIRDRARSERSRRPATAAAASERILDLGPWPALAERLPLRVEWAGHAYRIVLVEGRPVAHSTECPHWSGPLDDCAVEARVVTCPWHGYRFEVGTGRSADGRGLRLRRAPLVEIDDATARARLVAPRSEKRAVV